MRNEKKLIESSNQQAPNAQWLCFNLTTRIIVQRNHSTTALQPEINQKQFNAILINRYLRMKSNPKH